MENSMDLRLAVLVDADNIPYNSIKGILEEVARYGTPTLKRIYGDWTTPQLSGWKQVLLEHAITPVQQYGYTTGKNSTDSAMIIDAMDILYSGNVDGFCIISSDSDFTRLAIRLRESRMWVLGMGEKKTPNAFRVACDKFLYIEVIQAAATNDEAASTVEISHEQRSDLVDLLSMTIEDLADDNGWAFLGEVGNLLLRKQPDFDPRNYGYLKLTPLIKHLGYFEIDERRQTGKRNIKLIYIRNKSKAETKNK